MIQQIICWRCGHVLENLILPFSRQETCSACDSDQHVCRLCKNYSASLTSSCHEDSAEFVSDKERANFCDYFQAKPNAFEANKAINLHAKQDQAKNELDALFGNPNAEKNEPSIDKDDVANSSEMTEQEKAQLALDELFKKD